MDAQTLRLTLNRLLTPNTYPSSPHTFRIAADQWEAWLTAERRQVIWREKKVVLPKGANPRGNFSRKVLFECDHAGQYRDTRDPNLSPRKRRKTKDSIKCGCTASIAVSWLRDDDGTLEVVYQWQHVGHGTQLRIF
ncbi:hypothetical protein EXIGLDRAFT_771869 [Exidia glandulosa HHB12029]|uniref:FAR1 domain-containing protein n=1 Tax=Exidia glandulosa HHB12029 TaxID=1314781 RepID=A0A165FQ61_EXIGL|nr:hypothetical protein EXIGLDRAFT_771869 [Exidia glandulosa HHB12029]